MRDDMPALSSVFLWLAKDEKFSEQYARARESQADALADEIIHIADTPVIGVTTKIGSDGKTETTEGDMIQHRRLQVDARKWVASKLKPKKYGDKVTNEHSGIDGGPIVSDVRAFTVTSPFERLPPPIEHLPAPKTGDAV